jgi:lipoate-protein ligase A
LKFLKNNINLQNNKIHKKMFFKKNLTKSFCTFNKSSSNLNSTKASIYHHKSNNIVFNLAIEEFFYEHNNIDKPILLFFQNDKNVVIGKHQNPWKECNITLMEDENVNLASKKIELA